MDKMYLYLKKFCFCFVYFSPLFPNFAWQLWPGFSTDGYIWKVTPIESADRSKIIEELRPACPVGCQLKSRSQYEERIDKQRPKVEK
jgi:hypothetical protein